MVETLIYTKESKQQSVGSLCSNMNKYLPSVRGGMIILWNTTGHESGLDTMKLINAPMPLAFSHSASCVYQYIGDNQFKILKDRSGNLYGPDRRICELLNTTTSPVADYIFSVDNTENLVFFKTKYYNKITIHPKEQEEEVENGET